MDAGGFIAGDTRLFLHEGNDDVDSNEAGLIYPIAGQFVVPAPVLFRNMQSLGGTIPDKTFDQWVRNHLGINYTHRNYAVTTWRNVVHWTDIHWRRDFNVMMLCASNYLSLPGLTYS